MRAIALRSQTTRVLFTLGRAAGGRDAWRDQLSRYRVVITGNTGGVEARVREPAQTPAP
ncbi:hypothetical protein BN381_470010 [Candidatus Microthrix parvicella RN1]|uniref:Uncharacterized protein n=1 Tax=Candidatus Neomicrothrix parvicella RN1 TaxID=1229780 RepID=R4Z2F1_9ACTN|nr:hypothetical protein BN381_470010 [Candidatus Microthrix parvicella RN1]